MSETPTQVPSGTFRSALCGRSLSPSQTGTQRLRWDTRCAQTHWAGAERRTELGSSDTGRALATIPVLPTETGQTAPTHPRGCAGVSTHSPSLPARSHLPEAFSASNFRGAVHTPGKQSSGPDGLGRPPPSKRLENL